MPQFEDKQLTVLLLLHTYQGLGADQHSGEHDSPTRNSSTQGLQTSFCLDLIVSAVLRTKVHACIFSADYVLWYHSTPSIITVVVATVLTNNHCYCTVPTRHTTLPAGVVRTHLDSAVVAFVGPLAISTPRARILATTKIENIVLFVNLAGYTRCSTAYMQQPSAALWGYTAHTTYTTALIKGWPGADCS